MAVETSTTVAHKILFRQMGENASSARDPFAVVESIEGDIVTTPCGRTFDLSTEDGYCYNSGDNRIVSKRVYEVVTIELPTWLPAAEWLARSVQWKYAWGFGVTHSWDAAAARWIAYSDIGEVLKYELVKLLGAKRSRMRSSFRISLRERVEEWLATPADDRSYNFPLSPRQQDALTKYSKPWEVKNLSSSIYRSGHAA